MAPGTGEAVRLNRGDELRRQQRIHEAIQEYLAFAAESETPPAGVCLKLARSFKQVGDHASAVRWALAVTDAGDDFQGWVSAASLLSTSDLPHAFRRLRVGILGSYTTTQFVPLLRLAGLRSGVAIELYECAYAQYRQDTLDPHSGLYAFRPDVVVLAVHEGELQLPEFSTDPESDVAREEQRWTSLWRQIATTSGARVVQHNFVLPAEAPFGHLGAVLPGSRHAMIQALNARLARASGAAVSIVDVDRTASLFGKARWQDPRYWYMSRQAVSFEALPMLARHTAAVIAASVGTTRKCLVLDLDNTIWGGVIGEDRLDGIRLGHGVEGEAFSAFQEYILKLKNKGVIIAVCSKNNEQDAKEPFEKHSGMRLRLEDIAIFCANWESKVDNIKMIAKALNLGLDALVFVDDNPVERTLVRKFLPEVDVITLPENPCLYVRTLANSLAFETAAYTPDDARRTELYRTRALVEQEQAAHASLEDFHRSLEMCAVVEPFTHKHLPRIVQLIGKTNQFNLTTRRYTAAEVTKFITDDTCVHFTVQLNDRYGDHGIVAVMIAFVRGCTVEIDTWLMSCRVVGRTLESTMLAELCRQTILRGARDVLGRYIPTPKNAMVAELYPKLGFSADGMDGESTLWRLNLTSGEIPPNEFIRLQRTREGQF